MSLHGSAPVVASGPLVWFKRWCQGPLVELRVGDSRLRVTPNHPVLTHAGWVPARTVPVGAYVVAYDGAPVPTVGERHDRLAAERGSLTVPVSGRDFRGDGDRFSADVVLEREVPLQRPLCGDEGVPPGVPSGRLWAVLGALSTAPAFGCATWVQACVKVPDLARVWPGGEPSRRAAGVDPTRAVRLGPALAELPQPPVDPGELASTLLGLPGTLWLVRVEAVSKEHAGAYVHDLLVAGGCYTAGAVVVG